MPELPSKLLLLGSDNVTRCWWCGNDPLYVDYHDREWGFPVGDDVRLFENICLDGFQSGLSWITILRKRENFRRAFRQFDFERVARFNRRDIDRLMNDAGIVRNRGKIDATINNARRTIEMIERYGSLGGFLWQFAPSKMPPFDGRRAETEESRALSKALKKHGWSFVGPTTIYAFMQATGLVNDHLPGCAIQAAARKARREFSPPGVNTAASDA
jgi:DNA-3-methyladenine glycosylase I